MICSIVSSFTSLQCLESKKLLAYFGVFASDSTFIGLSVCDLVSIFAVSLDEAPMLPCCISLPIPRQLSRPLKFTITIVFHIYVLCVSRVEIVCLPKSVHWTSIKQSSLFKSLQGTFEEHIVILLTKVLVLSYSVKDSTCRNKRSLTETSCSMISLVDATQGLLLLDQPDLWHRPIPWYRLKLAVDCVFEVLLSEVEAWMASSSSTTYRTCIDKST